jgi:hypothetical protein
MTGAAHNEIAKRRNVALWPPIYADRPFHQLSGIEKAKLTTS